MSIYYNLVAGNPAEGENSFTTAAGEFSTASPTHVEEALQAATPAFPSFGRVVIIDLIVALPTIF